MEILLKFSPYKMYVLNLPAAQKTYVKGGRYIIKNKYTGDGFVSDSFRKVSHWFKDKGKQSLKNIGTQIIKNVVENPKIVSDMINNPSSIVDNLPALTKDTSPVVNTVVNEISKQIKNKRGSGISDGLQGIKRNNNSNKSSVDKVLDMINKNNSGKGLFVPGTSGKGLIIPGTNGRGLNLL